MQVSRRVPLGLRHPARVFWVVFLAVVLGDQLSKSFVRVLWSSPVAGFYVDTLIGGVTGPALKPWESVPLLGEAFRLVLVRNEGAAFGLLPGRQPIFIATSLIVLIAVAAYWRRDKPASWPVVVGTSLISAGALGNLIDRAFIGKVTDFFEAAFIDFPVFNIADSAIFIGVALLMIWLLFGPQPEAEGGEELESE